MEDMTYEKAMRELQTLSTELEEGKIPVDELPSKVERAQALLRFCRGKLRDAEAKAQDLLKED